MPNQKLYPNELSRLFPNASKSFIANNSDSHARLSSGSKECDSGLSLDDSGKRKAKGCHRFKIRFIVYNRYPCDWDAYHIKELQDLLVHAGVLPDDDWLTLEGEVVSRKAKDQTEEKTVIEIYSTQDETT